LYNIKGFNGPEQVIKNREEAITNIKRFNEDLPISDYLIATLSKYRDWYYVREHDIWGPKKFIGFRDMTSKKYEALKNDPDTNSRGNFDSSLLGPMLDSLSELATGDEELQLREKLEEYLIKYGRIIRTNAVIYIIS